MTLDYFDNNPNFFHIEIGSNHSIKSRMCPLKPLFYSWNLFGIFKIRISIYIYIYNTIMLRCKLKNIQNYVITLLQKWGTIY
jgi:hypothetical protein